MSLGCFPADQGQIHLNCRASLAELVMNLARDRGTFFFAHLLQTRRESAEFIERSFELLLGPFAIRDLNSQLVVHPGENSRPLLKSKLQ